MKILVVEDDQNSAAILLQLLAESHYAIDYVTNAETALQYVEAYAYDLIVLDVMLPDSSGIELCGKLRSAGYTIPVILLTAKGSANDLVMGLEAGADDYMIKPYNFEELIARIRALLRRYSDRDTLPKEFIWENLRLDFAANRLTYNGQLLYLTQKEYRLLELFLRHPQQIFSRSALLDRVWSAGEFPSEDAVTTHIKGLRQKLKTAGISQDPIETLYGLGYRLRTPLVEESQAIANPDNNLKENKPKENNQKQPDIRVKEIMALVTKNLQASLVDIIDRLQQLAIALQEGRLDPDLRQEGFMEAHRLIGSLGCLGFSAGSEIARQIEQMLTVEFPLVATDSGKLMRLICELQVNTSDAAKENQNQTEVNSDSNSSCNLKLPQLMIVDEDKKFVLEIKREVENFGVVVQSAYDLTTARLQIANSTPDLILLDVFPNRSENGLTLLNELTAREPKIPTVMMSAVGGLSDRVVAAHDGICTFIEKPVSVSEVVQTLTKILYQKRGDRHKVMVVDDDLHMLAALQILLEQWDLEVMILQDPQEFWRVLETFSPDLLVLDLIMPEYSGLDLCRAVRTSSLWFDLPIVFLSSQSDRETIRDIFAAGADDYLSKPIVEEDLQIRILSRLQRSRMSHQIADFDGLTEVYTHRRGLQGLTQLLRLAKRNEQTVCLAILDLDLFKLVNDRYGHSMGDLVLVRFGNFLRQYFRSEDVAMRWGGEEFVVGLYGADCKQSVERLQKFLAIWRQQKFDIPDGKSFTVTFSAGVAEYPQDGDTVEDLYRKMDAALYRAKAKGRNCIVAAGNF